MPLQPMSSYMRIMSQLNFSAVSHICMMWRLPPTVCVRIGVRACQSATSLIMMSRSSVSTMLWPVSESMLIRHRMPQQLYSHCTPCA